MQKWGAFAAAVLFLLTAVGYGVSQSATTYPEFWSSFLPSLWANVIGVTLAATIGIPIGFAVNHYFMILAEERKRRSQLIELRDILEQVRREVNLHSGALQRLWQLFSLPQSVEGQTQQTSQPTTTADVMAALLLQDVLGRQFLSSRTSFEIGESLLSFEISNYYARVWELNRLLNLRIQDTQHPGIWERPIEGLVRVVWTGQQQLDLEIQQAIQRLSGAITPERGK